MKKIFFIRQEDYWIYFLSTFAVLLTASMLYAGVLLLRILVGVPAIALIWFLSYIIRKNYSKPQSVQFIVITIVMSALLALFAYYLTK